MLIKDKIKTRRTELGLTLEEVASEAGVAKSTVKKWEDGVIGSMRLTNIKALARALSVEPVYLIFDDVDISGNLINEGGQIISSNSMNNGIIGKDNKENIILNEKPLPALDRAILAMCTGLDDAQKSEILSLATDMFSHNMRKNKKNKE